MEKVKSKEIRIKRILIMGIFIILIIALIAFLIYEVFFVDILGIFAKKEEIPIDNTTYINEVKNYEETNDNQVNQVPNNIVIGGNTNTIQIKHYYYNQLDTTSKVIYEALENNIDNLKTGTYEINFGTQFNNLINSDEGEEKLKVAFQSAWNAFTYDYVDIFYIDVSKLVLTTKTTTIGGLSINEVSLSKDTNENYLTAEVGTSEELKEKIEYVSNIRKQIVSQLDGYSQYEQVKFLHNWMIDNFKYDTTYQKENAHNIYGAFSEREVVCEGYARTFKYILDGLGIESVLVSGPATNSEGQSESHVWNYVRLGEKWYAVDVTWDDPVIVGGGNLTEELRYKYFLKGSDEFLKNHQEDGLLSENSMQFIFPILEKENY